MRLRLFAVTDSSTAMSPSERRVLTSMNTSVSQSIATRSSSPSDVLKFRARILRPFRLRNRAAILSPWRPRRLCRAIAMFFDAAECSAMEGGWAVSGDGGFVSARRVSLVFFQAVLRILPGQGAHEQIAMDFGENGSGADAKTQGVALHDSELMERRIGNRVSVNKDEIRRKFQLFHGPLHGDVSSLQDIDTINYEVVRLCNSIRNRLTANQSEQLPAPALGQLLRVPDALDIVLERKNNRGCNDGTA